MFRDLLKLCNFLLVVHGLLAQPVQAARAMVSLFGVSCWFVFQHDHLKGLPCSCTSVRKTPPSCCVVRFLKIQLFSCVRGAAIVKMPTTSPNSQRVKAGLKLTSIAWLYDRMDKSWRLTCLVRFRLG